jgi:oligosaccharide repeat unit polymerase
MQAGTELQSTVHPQGQLRAALSILAFLGFAVAIPLVLRATSEAPYTETDFLIRYSVVLYAAFRISTILWREPVTPVAGVFWMFVYICMGVVPLAQLTTGASTMLALQVDDATLHATTALTLLGCISFDLAYNLRLFRQMGRAAPLRTLRSMDTLRIFASVAIFGGLIYVAQLGGLGVFFASRQEAGQALDQLSPDSGQAVRAIVSAFGSVSCLVALIFYLHALRLLRSSLNLLDVFLMVALVGMNIVVNNPISNSRYWALAVLFGLIMPLIRFRKSLFNVAIIGGIVAAILVFPLSDVTRRRAGTGVMVQADSVWRMISTKDYDQFSMFANTLGFTADEGFAWGYQFLGPLLFWVPRVIWPTKPLDSGVEVGQWMSSANVNLSSPLWAEAWINFGVPGVVVTLALLGLLSRRFDAGFGAPGWSANAVGYLGVSILSGYMFILLRGSLLQSMGRLMVLALSIACLTAAVKRKPGVEK